MARGSLVLSAAVGGCTQNGHTVSSCPLLIKRDAQNQIRWDGLGKENGNQYSESSAKGRRFSLSAEYDYPGHGIVGFVQGRETVHSLASCWNERSNDLVIHRRVDVGVGEVERDGIQCTLKFRRETRLTK